jgi:hypothetical protein
MSEPRRLLDTPESLEARLLASALDERPPRDLLSRTLAAAAGAATGGSGGASGPPNGSGGSPSAGPSSAAGGSPSVSSGAWPAGRPLGAPSAAPPMPHAAAAAATTKAASGGILGAVAIGALAGLVFVGGAELVSGRRGGDPERPARADSRSARTSEVPNKLGSAPAPARASSHNVTGGFGGGDAPPESPVQPHRSSEAGPSPLAAELALLDEARAALREGDRAGARDALDRYERTYPRGQMAREAALIRAEASEDPPGAKP